MSEIQNLIDDFQKITIDKNEKEIENKVQEIKEVSLGKQIL